ncbi:hypothetical protein Ancab_038470 [Ancistrocladus abbreviatus]
METILSNACPWDNRLQIRLSASSSQPLFTRIVNHCRRHPQANGVIINSADNRGLSCIQLIGFYSLNHPVLPDDLGMGMALASTSYDFLPLAPTMMTGLTVPEGIHRQFFNVPWPTLVATTDGIQHAHSATLLADESQKYDDDKLLIDHVICLPEDSTKTNLNSNDMVV